MENARTSFLSSLFPWLAPLVIHFEIVDGGINIWLSRNQQLRGNWQPSDLRRVLPPELITWMEQYRIHLGPQPYPVAKQFWQTVLPYASKKLVIDLSVLANLEEINQPSRIVLIWELQRTIERIVGYFDGADRYLGMNWFQRGNKVWSLLNQLSATVDAQLKNLILPLHQASHLLTTIIPEMNQFLSTCADFQLITDFAPQVIVADARSGGLILKLQCNYPQLLATLHIPQQSPDNLLADKAIIVFPQQARTPILTQLFQRRLSIVAQGTDVPQIIREQLPVMRQYHQISDEMAEKITRANPIVPLAALKPVLSFTHTLEHGLGKYALVTKYFYNQHEIDMADLLAAYQRGQRFIQQYDTWFEWPENSYELAQNIQRQVIAQALRPEEVMGFDTRRTTLLASKPAVTLQPSGRTPFERGQTLFKHLQQHGIPGGIIGETGTAKLFVDACEQLWRGNRYASMLWLVPSNKKGSVTRAVNSSTIARYINVASLVTLRDEPALFSRHWTLVILQDLDHLLDGSMQASMLPQLRWQWTLMSVSSVHALHPYMMRVLHLSEQYFEQFHVKYLFDLERSYERPMPGQKAGGWNAAQAASPIMPKKEEPIRPERVTPRDPAFQTPRASSQTRSDASRIPETAMERQIRELQAAIQHRTEAHQAELQRRIAEQRAREAQAKQKFQSTPPPPRLEPQPRPKTEQSRIQPELSSAKSTFENTRPVLRAVHHALEFDPQKIAEIREGADLLHDRMTLAPEDEEQMPSPVSSEAKTPASAPLAAIDQVSLQTPAQVNANGSMENVIAQPSTKDQVERKELFPKKAQTDSPRAEPTSQSHIMLDAEIISKLHEGSEQFQERFLYTTSELPVISLNSLPDVPDEPLPDSSAGVVLHETVPDVDEDWQEIAQKWRAEHWEIIVAVWQGRVDQVEVVAHRAHRPSSQLIDEINEPVAERQGDNLIDFDARPLTITKDFCEVAEKLARSYLDSRGS